MGQGRRQRSGEFKAKVVIQALKGQKTVNEIAGLYGVHPVQVTQWKRQALEELPGVFGERRAHKALSPLAHGSLVPSSVRRAS